MSTPVPPAITADSGTPSEPAAPTELGAAPVRYSVAEAARVLGISERAVRKRIDPGTLEAVKDGRAWSVVLPTISGTTRAAVPAAPVTIVSEPESGTGPEPATPPVAQAVPGTVPLAVDLAPLADLIERQASEIQRLTEAATVWQVRAMQAEERLHALSAGDNTRTDAPSAAQEPQHGTKLAETAPDPSSPWWMSWWRRLLGGQE